MNLVAVSFLACSLFATAEGQPQLTCYTSKVGCTGVSFAVNSSESCCCLYQGYFMRVNGQQECLPCLVYGWQDAPHFTAVERFADYELPIGYIKGGTTRAATRRQFIVEAIDGTAANGRNNDFLLKTFTVSPRPREIQYVRVAFFEDQVALEPNETFKLKLTQVTEQKINEVFLHTLNVSITDQERVSFYFTESDYRGREDSQIMAVTVERDRQIASSVTLHVIPLNYTQFYSSGLPTPSGFPTIPPLDTLSPNRAKSFPVEERDFSINPVVVTFEPNELRSDRKQASVSIPNDDVNEADEFFIVILELVGGVNRVNLVNQNVSLCRIVDADPLRIGFEFPAYTFVEHDRIFNDTIQLVKEDGIVSEQTFDIQITIQSALGFGYPDATFQRIQSGQGDYAMAAEKLQFTFKPEEQSIPLPIAIMDDTLLEQTEAFLLQLQLFVDRGPQFAAGKFLSAIVTIQDNDIVSAGFEDSGPFVVDEDIGMVELCLRVFSPQENENLPLSFYLVVEIVGETAGPNDYVVDSLQLDYFDEDTRRQCFNLTVIDDRFFEARESLKVVVYLNPYESPPALELTPNKAVVEIVDNDLVTVKFTEANQTLYRKVGETEVCVIRNKLTDDVGRIELIYENASGDGESGYKPLDIIPQYLSFTPDSKDVLCATIVTAESARTENTLETFEVWLSPITEGIRRGNPSTVVITVLVLEVELTSEEYTVPEGNGTVTVCVQTNTRTQDSIQVLVSASLISAEKSANSADFIQETKVINIESSPISSTNCTVFNITDDQLALEGSETFAVGISLPPGSPAVLGTLSQASVTIEDDDELTLDFDNLTYTTTEPSVAVCLSKSGETLEDIEFELLYTTVTLQARLVFTATSIHLTVFANETLSCVKLNITDSKSLARVQQTGNFSLSLSLQIDHSGVIPAANWSALVTLSGEEPQLGCAGNSGSSSAASILLACALAVVAAIAAIIAVAALVKERRKKSAKYTVLDGALSKGLEEGIQDHFKNARHTYRLLSSNEVLEQDTPETDGKQTTDDPNGNFGPNVLELASGQKKDRSQGVLEPEWEGGEKNNRPKRGPNRVDTFDEDCFQDGTFAPEEPEGNSRPKRDGSQRAFEQDLTELDGGQKSDDLAEIFEHKVSELEELLEQEVPEWEGIFEEVSEWKEFYEEEVSEWKEFFEEEVSEWKEFFEEEVSEWEDIFEQDAPESEGTPKNAELQRKGTTKKKARHSDRRRLQLDDNAGLKVKLGEPHTQCVSSFSALESIRNSLLQSTYGSMKTGEHIEGQLLSVCFQKSQGIKYLSSEHVKLGQLTCSIHANAGIKLGNCNLCVGNPIQALKHEKSSVANLSEILNLSKKLNKMAKDFNLPLNVGGHLTTCEVATCLEKVHEAMEMYTEGEEVVKSVCVCLEEICKRRLREDRLSLIDRRKFF